MKSQQVILILFISSLCALNTQALSKSQYDPNFLEKVELDIDGAGTMGTYSFISNQNVTWLEAMNFCGSFVVKDEADVVTTSVDLLSIETSAENTAITDYLSSIGNNNNQYWISANKIGRSSAFIWLNNEFMSYTSWGTGEPNNQANNCIYLQGGKWYDGSCQATLMFICEYTPVAPVIIP